MDFNGYSMDDLEPRPIHESQHQQQPQQQQQQQPYQAQHFQGFPQELSQMQQQQMQQQQMQQSFQQRQSPVSLYQPNFQQPFDQNRNQSTGTEMRNTNTGVGMGMGMGMSQKSQQSNQQPFGQPQYPQMDDGLSPAPSFQQQHQPYSSAMSQVPHQFQSGQTNVPQMNGFHGNNGGTSVTGSVPVSIAVTGGGGMSVAGSVPGSGSSVSGMSTASSHHQSVHSQSHASVMSQSMSSSIASSVSMQQQMRPQQFNQPNFQKMPIVPEDFTGPQVPDFKRETSTSIASLGSASQRSGHRDNSNHFYSQDHRSHGFYAEKQQQRFQQTPRGLGPVDPLPDNPAQYAKCVTEPTISIINAAIGGKPNSRRVEVMRANDNTCHAYAIDKHTPPLDIINDGIRRGKIFRGVVYRRIAPLSNFFETPSRDKALFVTIKRYNIDAMRDYLRDETSPIAKENPDVEIERLQTMGDNVHIVGKFDRLMTDALVNERYVYIIHPYTGQDTLTHRIARIHPNSEGDLELPMPRILPDILEQNARALFRQLLASVHYMNATHGVCHCDLTTDSGYLKGSSSGDNDKLLLTGLIRSVRAPPATWQTSVADAPVLRNYGGTTTDKSFWAPEVWMSRIQDVDGNDSTWEHRGFSPPARDLWAAVLMLFRYVTGEMLYELPDPVDPTYRYFVLSQGLSPTSPLHEELSEQWNELQEDLALDNAGAGFVMRRIDVLHHKLQLLTPELLELFDRSLRISPLERWTLMDVVQSRWMNMDVPSASTGGGTSVMDQQSDRSHRTHSTHNSYHTHTTQQSQQQSVRTYSIDPF